MSKKYVLVCLLFVGVVLASGAGCSKSTTVVINPGTQITTQVGFTKDIIPLLTKNCALSGCHGTGGHSPDLTAANAFQSLTTGGFVKAGDPNNSVVMDWLTGKKQPAMPLGSAPNEDIIAEVYAWIEQGAQNN